MSHPRVRSPYLLLGYLLAGLPAEGLTIYRFGGQDREPPAEMGAADSSRPLDSSRG